jgi:diadenosine tetraphosphate (Ap4A) HIT family hydrolase
MFALDPRLAADTAELARWPLCRVLLMNDANYPWLILVPEREGVREIIELSDGDRLLLMEEITRAARLLAAIAKPDKLNIAALGNAVPQLHVHLIARFTDDAAWPRPVWGVKPRLPYAAEAIEDFRRKFAAASARV